MKLAFTDSFLKTLLLHKWTFEPCRPKLAFCESERELAFMWVYQISYDQWSQTGFGSCIFFVKSSWVQLDKFSLRCPVYTKMADFPCLLGPGFWGFFCGYTHNKQVYQVSYCKVKLVFRAAIFLFFWGVQTSLAQLSNWTLNVRLGPKWLTSCFFWVRASWDFFFWSALMW